MNFILTGYILLCCVCEYHKCQSQWWGYDEMREFWKQIKYTLDVVPIDHWTDNQQEKYTRQALMMKNIE